MRKIYTYLLLASLLFLSPFITKAQLTSTTNVTTTAIANALSGQGITVRNVQVRCGTNQFATFTSSGPTGVGINQGLLLTTGTANNVGSPASVFLSSDITAQPLPSIIGRNGVDAQFPYLDGILPTASSVNDACEISFDLIPNCSLINLKYVFGSDEYPTFSANSCPPVTNNIYDIFAFLISGPNPLGGTYNNQNLAFVPGTNLPVTIHSVSPFCNAGMYVDNETGTTVAYDGYTTPFTAAVDVLPCQTYTMKLQIADGGDGIYDSGVFIEYQSFACQNSVISTSPNKIICPSQLTTVTATNASSYTWSTSPATPITYINDSTIVIAPLTSTTVTVNGYAGCTPATQTLSSKKILLTINPPNNINFDNAFTQHATCDDDNGRFRVGLPISSVTGGYSPYTFDFNNSGVFSSNKTFTGLFGGTYTVTVKDNKGCTYSEDYVINNTPSITTYTAQIDSSTCGLNNGQIILNSVIGGTSPYTYTFNGGTPTTNNSVTGLFSQTNYKIAIVDSYGCSFLDSVTIKSFPSPEKIYLSSFKDTCDEGRGKVVVDSVRLGTPPYLYSFGNSTVYTSNTSMSNLYGSMQYIVKVKDFNNCERQDTVRIFTIPKPKVSAGVNQVLCNGADIILNGSILEGATTGVWETSGSGTLLNPTFLQTKYLPSAADVDMGVVNFSLKTTDHFYACAEAVSATNVTISPIPVASFSSDSLKHCVPANEAIFNLSTGPITEYQWYMDGTLVSNAVDFKNTFTNEGRHDITLVVATAIGCKDTLTVNDKIIPVKQPVASYYVETANPSVNEVTSFVNTSTFADSYKWNFGDLTPIENTANPQHVYTISDYYDVTLIAQENNMLCADTTVTTIYINPSTRLFIPTSFTPNGDGLNDSLYIGSQGVESFDMKIFNRWGSMVHHSNDVTNKWDGKYNGELIQDAFIYVIRITDIHNNEYNYRGTITILP